MKRARFGFAFAALVAAALPSGRAHAYVRSKTDAGKPFYWPESCVPITIYLNGFPKSSGMTKEQVVKSVTAAAHTWSADAVVCGDGSSPSLEIVPTIAADDAVPPAIAWDAKNVVTFRVSPETWGKSGKGGVIYPAEALAVTTVTARLDGHIVDVDMEVNGITQQWMNLDPGIGLPFMHGADSDIQDLQNALTHEFGHFIGLDHTCFIPSKMNPAVDANAKMRPTDNTDAPVPDCDSAPAKVEVTVMFNQTITSGETSKRFLSPDDTLAVCDIYSASADHEACALDTPNPGCAVSPIRSSRRAHVGLFGGLAACGLAIALAAAKRRRARRA